MDELIENESESEIVDYEVMNIKRFEQRLLTKPSNLSTRQAVNNLQMVVQGKYNTNNKRQSATTSKLERSSKDGSSSESDISYKVSNHFSKRVPLPPKQTHHPVP